jgi:hypothetical protein
MNKVPKKSNAEYTTGTKDNVFIGTKAIRKCC